MIVLIFHTPNEDWDTKKDPIIITNFDSKFG